MLVVRDLHKRYGTLLALQGVSFEVGAGEVIGFLGPNGAGKSTTMRIVTGYLSANRGWVTVDGIDAARYPTEVRKRIGYLPESTPLNLDMRVDEYLLFRAQLKGVRRRERRARVGRVIERTGLIERTRQIIRTLSKGYRQRVGIADAMVGSPQLLILDEPTIGLDPNQIREVRRLIRELAEEHTLLISTHILPEVEQVADRVVIVANGRTVADDTVQGLIESHQRPALVAAIDGVGAADLERLDGIARASALDDGRFALELQQGVESKRAQLAVFKAAAERGWALTELAPQRTTLEQIFSELTQGGRVGEVA
ncbi:MAG: ATP-binding cassette domain-containing protein [Planctomycetes bacterium]|nr:ATP-binding cassette domain-containing protein [Planctomycetota bacterium]